MTRFNKLKVTDIMHETADAVSVAFEVPENLKKEYTFKQGQYLTLRFTIDNEELRRSYSICSSPFDNELRVAIKKVKQGKVSSFINTKLKVGDVVDVMNPMGSFYTELDAAHKKTYVLFAGGSGITPMMSIIKTVLKMEPMSSITLLYGNNDEASIIFNNQLKQITEQNNGRLKVAHILASPPNSNADLLSGMMTKEKNISLLNEFTSSGNDNEYFICGPAPMMDNVVAALKEKNIDESKIHIEYFTAPVDASVAKPIENAGVSGASVTIVIDGDEHNVVFENNESVLEAALRIGLDAPYACQGGSCCTCRALLEDGKVEMLVNYALSASEVKQGYILTCQSRPTTNSIRVNYDKGL